MSAADTDHLYIGSAGEYRVMAELLARGYNVAVPRVDTGDDVLVIKVEDEGDEYSLRRVQVKTARPATKSGSYTFKVKRLQLESAANVDLWYVFLARSSDRWLSTMVFRREVLRDVQWKRQRKSSGDTVTFEITLSDDGKTAMLGSAELSKHIDDWEDWPTILPGTLTPLRR
ncbi:MAG: hypothetical protein HY909_07035 [Deltaproteobacteria bacterium]|nr:hypothetical protein [Deltaproteobacteria bacterium]